MYKSVIFAQNADDLHEIIRLWTKCKKYNSVIFAVVIFAKNANDNLHK